MKLKQWQNIFHVIVNASCIVQHVIQNKKQNNKTCQCEYKNLHKCEKEFSWNPSTYFFENSKYLKSVADTSVTKCDEIVIFMDNLTT